ncbi:hypothetical protein [Hoeflea ulvae]|uniref:Uncharacterized protein n=1 Tax=Hoeflea ulvae TaxID=2983764 RepID=A0ABT3YI62_9HYPH|nr:hypothetical protein [Hoeflea ulvae]MCY0095517.1 hypothetical protein [Hoeflea ulvae]
MPESESDQCPFCNAPWGECGHVQLLLEWETDALFREALAELGSAAIPDGRLEAGKIIPIAAVRTADSAGK